MTKPPRVILSGFADEAANNKTAVEQFSAFAALGLQYYSLRFVDVGKGIKNVMQLTKGEITKLRHLEDEYGMNVASIGLADWQSEAFEKGGWHQKSVRVV